MFDSGIINKRAVAIIDLEVRERGEREIEGESSDLGDHMAG